MQKTVTKLLILTIAFTFALSVNYLFAAWVGPTQAPPGGNTPAPVHVGLITQTKDGGLIVGALRSLLDVYVDGKVGIGTTNPSEALEVAGGVKVGNTTNANAGTIRWTGADLEVYNGSAWVSLTAGDTTIVSGDATDCNNVGGNWVDAQGVCYLPNAGGCPSGWTPKESYSSTSSNTCKAGCAPCSTGSHNRTNAGIESCKYGTVCAKQVNPEYAICYASQTEIGCVKN
jgi:hypothetical protein